MSFAVCCQFQQASRARAFADLRSMAVLGMDTRQPKEQNRRPDDDSAGGAV